MAEDKKVVMQTGFLADNLGFLIKLRNMHIMLAIRCDKQIDEFIKFSANRDVSPEEHTRIIKLHVESELHTETVGLLNTITGDTPTINDIDKMIEMFK